MSYREYVRIQREKDAGAYSVKAVLSQSDLFANAPEGWRSVRPPAVHRVTTQIGLPTG